VDSLLATNEGQAIVPKDFIEVWNAIAPEVEP
jgi:hypothetical protein